MLQTERVTAIAQRTDRSRLVTGASGWHDKPCGDIIDMHVYPGPGKVCMTTLFYTNIVLTVSAGSFKPSIRLFGQPVKLFGI